MVPQEIFGHPTYTFNDDGWDSLHVQGWVSFSSIAQSSLGIYPHGCGEVRSHPFFFFPSFYLVHYCRRKGEGGLRHCAKGRRTYCTVHPPKPYLSDMWSRQNFFNTDALTFRALLLITMIRPGPVTQISHLIFLSPSTCPFLWSLVCWDYLQSPFPNPSPRTCLKI